MLKLKWQRAGLGSRRHFVALDPANTFSTSVCVVRYCWEAEHLAWSWTANHPLGSDSRIRIMRQPVSGYAPTRMEAAALAEEAHQRFLKAIDEMGWRDKLVSWHHHNLHLDELRARWTPGWE